MELVVVTPFLTYHAGDVISDPAMIASLLPEYEAFVVRVGGGGAEGEVLVIASVIAAAGKPCLITGNVSGSNLAAGLEYSVDNGTSWGVANALVVAGSSWSCQGPVYPSAASGVVLLMRDRAAPSVTASSPPFAVFAGLGVSSVAGLSGTIAAPALKAALAIGVADVAGLGNAAASNFGSVTGSVADGGSLTTVSGSLSNLGLSAATLAGSLSSLGSASSSLAGSVSALGSAVASSTSSLTALGTSVGNLGGSVSSLGASVAAAAGSQTALAGSVTALSGSVSTLGSNAASLSGSLAALSTTVAAEISATSGNVLAALGGGAINAVAFADTAGSSGIFSHGPVPSPLAVRSGLALGDRWKLGSIFNFGEVWDTEANYDAWPKLQSFLLYCQLTALALKNTSFDANCFRMSVTAYLPRGTYLVSQPLVVPEFVRLHTDGVILRAPYTGDQSNNGTTSVPGAFYAASQGGQGQFLPTVIVAPRGHASALNVYVGNSNPNFRGSGVAIGKTWQAQLGQGCTIGVAGSGYSVGDIVVLAQPSVSTYWPWAAQVTAVSGSGGITAATVYQSGAYALPPNLQTQQWSAANGFAVFDPANPGCFLQTKAYKSDFKTPSPGAGATLAPSWTPDFTGGQYNIGAAIQADTLIGHLNITGFVPALYSATYGPTFGVLVTGLNGIIDEIELLGGNDGIYCRFANDWRIGTINCVGSGCGLQIYGSGSIECPNVVFDTCGAALLIDQSDRITVRGLAFFEQNNLPQPYAFPASLANATAQGFTGYSAIQIGQASTVSYPNAHLDIAMQLVNMGGLPASTIALYPGTSVGSQSPRAMPYSMTLSYTFSSRFDIQISNVGEAGGQATLLPSQGFACFGQGVDASNDVRGSIDGAGVTGPALSETSGHGWPACAARVWDAQGGGWQGVGGAYELIGSGVPSAATGAGKAGKGSTYRDIAGPGLYIQTGSASTPSWLQVS